MKGWIEENSTWIGAGLILLSLVGGTLLILKKGTRAGSPDAAENKDQKTVDLENKIADLERQLIELKSMSAPTVKPEATASPPTTSPSSTSNQPIGKTNINTASQSQLESLSGIGPTYAKRIIEYRNANGGFKSIDQIQNVKGIGAKTYAKFKDQISI